MDELQLEKLSIKELYQYRRQCADNRDIESLLTLAKYVFIKYGCGATTESKLPEICYYYGRLHQGEELKEFLKGKEAYLFMITEQCKELSQNLLNIGYKFPYLNESEISYLEEKSNDPKTIELFDIIMFDSDLLPRPIKKFDKNTLNRENKDFSNDFLLQVFDYFSKNEELDGSYDDLYVYSRINNEIIRKPYVKVGLGECCIIQPILSDEFWNVMKENYSEECADYFAQKLSFNEDWENFKNSDFIIDAESIEDIAKEYFNDSIEVENVKKQVALSWLKKINSQNIDI